MNTNRFSLIAALAFVAFLVSGIQGATAQSLQIVQTLSPSGSTLLTISGLKDPCYTIDQSNVVITGNAIGIDSTNHAGVCVPLLPPEFFTITVDVGHLALGHYTVVWTFDPPLGTLLPPTSFAFDATPDTSSIPTTGPLALVLMLASVALLGVFSLRHRRT